MESIVAMAHAVRLYTFAAQLEEAIRSFLKTRFLEEPTLLQLSNGLAELRHSLKIFVETDMLQEHQPMEYTQIQISLEEVHTFLTSLSNDLRMLILPGAHDENAWKRMTAEKGSENLQKLLQLRSSIDACAARPQQAVLDSSSLQNLEQAHNLQLSNNPSTVSAGPLDKPFSRKILIELLSRLFTQESPYSSSISRGCSIICQCTCHQLTGWSTSHPFLNALFGTLRGSSSNFPPKPCNEAGCANRNYGLASLSFSFPSWSQIRISCYIRLLLYAKGYSLNISLKGVQRYNSSSLHCVREGDVVGIFALLRAGHCSPDDEDEAGNSLLHIAVREGHLEMCRFLVEAGADTLRLDSHDRSPADLAWDRAISSSNSNDPLVELLDKSGVTLKRRQFSVLHLAVLGFTPLNVHTIIELRDPDLDSQDADQRTALYWAVRRGDVDTVSALLSAGANPRVGPSPLAWTCKNNGQGSSLLETLLDHGIDPDGHDVDGHTALHACGIFGTETSFVGILITRGADPNVIYRGPYYEYGGMTPLGFSALYGHPKVLTRLLQMGSHANMRDDEGRTPLHLAVQSSRREGKLECIRTLVNHGASLDIRDKGHHNPANIAMKIEDLDSLELLAEMGSELDFPIAGGSNSTSSSIILWPLMEKRTAVVEFLLERINLSEIHPSTGETVLHILAQHGGSRELIFFENLLSRSSDVSVFDTDPTRYEVSEELQENGRFLELLLRIKQRQRHEHWKWTDQGPNENNEASRGRSSSLVFRQWPHSKGNDRKTLKVIETIEEHDINVRVLTKMTVYIAFPILLSTSIASISFMGESWTTFLTSLLLIGNINYLFWAPNNAPFRLWRDRESMEDTIDQFFNTLAREGSRVVTQNGSDSCSQGFASRILGFYRNSYKKEEFMYGLSNGSHVEDWHSTNMFAAGKDLLEDPDSGYASDSSRSSPSLRPRGLALDPSHRYIQLDETLIIDPLMDTTPAKRSRLVSFRNRLILATIILYALLAETGEWCNSLYATFERFCRVFMRPKISKGHERITWTCWCGKEVFGDFPRAEPGKLASIQQALNTCTSDPNEPRHGTTVHPQFPIAAHINSESANTSHHRQAMGQNQQLCSSSPNVDPNRTSTPQALVPKFLELCINTGKLCQSLGEIDLTRVTNDKTLFAWVRKRYKEVRGPRRHWTQYLIKPVAMKFVAFGLENHMKVHIFREDAYPSAQQVATQKWHYAPCPLDSPLPMPSSAFIHYLYYCKDDDTGPSSPCRVWLDRLPKKMFESLLRTSDPLVHAFGIHIIEGWNITAVLWTLLSILTICLGPLVAYVVKKGDVQGATGLGGVIVAILMFIWMAAKVSEYGE